ncbi:hypothetical protein ACLI1A_07675 [Flavobacterium sp. RHBU_3]|uniref:hypothetical protein n=1 Tax=Flavobacterium sp. RHBU_3 TaxID=3391184 RepID=UPI0039853305
METTFHFSSADSLTQIPSWQIKETQKRQEYIRKHPESLIDFDEMMSELEKDFS